ncbi:SGNH/GDSL hydrolase family protein [Klebsiella quasipneumoniae]|uniref:SGNH/GDSL hydrolase family protein n=1 Tax=Klebsiella quasipneumoniae TaxID=1463165 RepID=UPI00352ACA64
MAEVPLPTPTDNQVPSTDIRDAVYAGAMLDKVVTSTELTYTDRLGGEHYTVDGIKAEGDKVVEETRQNLIPLSRQYMTLSDAQADIANIPEGSTTYVRSSDDSALAIEYMNISGTLEPTGRVMVSKLYIDEIKNRTPNIDRSSYWGGIVAADGTIGVSFRTSDNEPTFGKYGALSALTSSLTPFADIASGMATVNINSSFLVVANGTDGLSVPTIFNKITSTMFVKLFAVTTDEQVANIGGRSGYWGGIVAKNGQVGVVFRDSDNRPIFGGGGERGGDIFSRLEAVENSSGNVINKSDTAGDSTGAGTGAPAGYSFPDQLAALIGNGFVATNYSIGGQKSGQVAMRMGAKPIYLTVNGDVIPASGGSVTITQINGVSATAEPAYPSQDVRFLSTPSNTTTYTLDGWISGIKCRVTRTSSGGVEAYSLTALSGAGFRCLPGSMFVPDYAMQDHSDSEMWICVGINDFRSGATTAADYDADVAAIKSNIDALVNQAEKSGRPILVYGINTCNYSVEFLGGIRYQRIIEVNQYFSQKYPAYYVRGSNGRDLREELVSRYNASIAQDVTDFGNDIVPSSLRSDNRHPNATGYGVYAELGNQTRQRRG